MAASPRNSPRLVAGEQPGGKRSRIGFREFLYDLSFPAGGVAKTDYFAVNMIVKAEDPSGRAKIHADTRDTHWT